MTQAAPIDSASPRILLATLNGRYIHSSLGLRYLWANMGELQGNTAIREFTIQQRPIDIAEQLLDERPDIIGLGVYIWNIRETTELAALLKTLSPETTLILGGPEVSFETEQQAISAYADYVISGQGDLRFAQLCRELLAGSPPKEKIISAEPPALDSLALPYEAYSDEDIAHRVLYVEASRGCPFKCEFCLSALDKTAWPFDIDRFLDAMDRFYQRGARRFKFVDRTFNLKVEHSVRILNFFLERLNEDLFLHFELIPDRLPDPLKALITRFPPGSLQFEIGIQTLNPEIQDNISRRQDNAKSEENLRWLNEHSHAHIHADLIFGLPGETLESIAHGFDQLIAWGMHEIQLGILKRLRGSPIIRHTETYGMRYSHTPPYNVVATSTLDYKTLQRLSRMARYWDLIGNSGRFKHTLPLILDNKPFERFIALSDWLYDSTAQTHKIQLERLFALLHQGLTERFNTPEETLIEALWQDFTRSGIKGIPKFFPRHLSRKDIPTSAKASSVPRRQARHL